jgi:Fe-S cluster assembly protein SufD
MSNQSAVLEEMIETEPTHRAGRSIVSGASDYQDARLPQWFRDLQRAAWDTFEATQLPNRKEQAWRFSTIDALKLDAFVEPQPLVAHAREEVLDRSAALPEATARMIFADDQLIRRDPLPEKLQRLGVIFQPLERALIEHEALVRDTFMKEPAVLGSAKFSALHAARVRNGTFLYVPKGVDVELPLEVFHWLHGESTAVFPHLLLVAEELSSVTLIEHFRSTAPRRSGFACGVNDLVVRRGANVRYVCAQDWSEEVLAFQMNATTVDRDASAMSLNVNVGSAYSRFEGRSRLIGDGARSDMLAISVATGRQVFDARTLQDHESPHTTSDLLYKNALDGHARTTFGGLIRVEPHAHFTDAYQTVRNLLLSDDSEANSMPGLEILADNVKCSHGATSGQLHEEELFYLLARGISRTVAQQLLVLGFLNEVTERLPNAPIQQHVRDLIEAKFARAKS